MSSLLQSYPMDAPANTALEDVLQQEPSVWIGTPAHHSASMSAVGADSYGDYLEATQGDSGFAKQVQLVLQRDPSVWRSPQRPEVAAQLPPGLALEHMRKSSTGTALVDSMGMSQLAPQEPEQALLSQVRVLESEKAALERTVQLQRKHAEQLVRMLTLGVTCTDPVQAEENAHFSQAEFQIQATQLTELQDELLATKKVTSLQEEYCKRLVEVAQEAEGRAQRAEAELQRMKLKAKKRLLSDKGQLEQQQRHIEHLSASLSQRDSPQASSQSQSVARASPESLSSRIEYNARQMVKQAVANKRRSRSRMSSPSPSPSKSSQKSLDRSTLSPAVRLLHDQRQYHD